MRRCVFAAVKRKPVAETFDFLSRDGALGAHSVLTQCWTQCWTQCAPHWDVTLHRTLLRRTLGRSSGDSSAAGERASHCCAAFFQQQRRAHAGAGRRWREWGAACWKEACCLLLCWQLITVLHCRGKKGPVPPTATWRNCFQLQHWATSRHARLARTTTQGNTG